ncbi:MAG TPA: isochorismatase family cysteine hydrolase [Dictyobacter sp.]|jgi:nicotinamidase-related amidase|nr:isochorismatase family cysteine hydrolase [Dictyobacter sp.]
MVTSSIPENFLANATVFLRELVQWEQQLPAESWQSLASQAQQGQVALLSVDMINGFCHEGALASPRIEAVIPAVVTAFERAYAIGVRDFLLAQDSHTPQSVEFADFSPHCQAGTSEAENIPELASLPFAHLYKIFPKNSLNAFHGTELPKWLEERRDVRTVVIVGDCTDLCVYHAAMHFKLYANAHDLPLRVIVPANAVQTFDTPVATAKELGILPHDGDVTHLFFLYHMCLNGIDVVSEIQ